MATTKEDVRRDMDRARTDLSQALEAIGDRVAPKKVVACVKDDVHDKVVDVKERMNPTRLVRRPVEAVKRGVHSVMGSEPSTYANGFRNGNGAGVATTARRQTQYLAARAGDAAGSVAGSVADSVRNAPGVAREKAEGNPLAAGVLAVAAGFFAASLLPPTRRERDLVGQARARLEPIKEQAIEAGREVVSEVQGSAKAGLEEVKQKAETAAQEVKDEASTSARALAQEAKDDAGEVKEQARSSAGQVKGQARRATAQVKEPAGGHRAAPRPIGPAKNASAGRRASATARTPRTGTRSTAATRADRAPAGTRNATSTTRSQPVARAAPGNNPAVGGRPNATGSARRPSPARRAVS